MKAPETDVIEQIEEDDSKVKAPETEVIEQIEEDDSKVKAPETEVIEQIEEDDSKVKAPETDVIETTENVEEDDLKMNSINMDSFNFDLDPEICNDHETLSGAESSGDEEEIISDDEELEMDDEELEMDVEELEMDVEEYLPGDLILFQHTDVPDNTYVSVEHGTLWFDGKNIGKCCEEDDGCVVLYDNED